MDEPGGASVAPSHPNFRRASTPPHSGRHIWQVLLPLVNVPLIDYTLEWLASSGVEEVRGAAGRELLAHCRAAVTATHFYTRLLAPAQVYVFCCAHAQQIVDHVSARWGPHAQPGFRVATIVARDCFSAGDALRTVDQRNLIRGDFVLVSGDTVTNMNLGAALAAHRARREKDKLSIMTMVMRPVDPRYRREGLGELDVVLATTAGNDPLHPSPPAGAAAASEGGCRLLHYEEAGSGGDGGGSALPGPWVRLGHEATFAEHTAVRVRNDLSDW